MVLVARQLLVLLLLSLDSVSFSLARAENLIGQCTTTLISAFVLLVIFALVWVSFGDL